MKNKIIYALFSCLLLPHPANAEEPQPSRICELAPQISNLIKLKWDGPRIVFDKSHWAEQQKDEKEHALQRQRSNDWHEMKVAKYVRQGTPQEQADEALRRADMHAKFLSSSSDFFKDLIIAAKADLEGGSGSVDDQLWHASGNEFRLSISYNLDSQMFAVKIRDNQRPAEELSVVEHGQTGMQIESKDAKKVMSFWQSPDGTTRFIIASSDHNEAVEVEDYASFAEQHPKLAEEFWSSLQKRGIAKPTGTIGSGKEPSPKGELVPESLAEFQSEIGNLVRLKITKNKLRIDVQHWKRMTANRTDEDRLDELARSLEQRGLTPEMARKVADSRFRMLEKMGRAKQSEERALFEKLAMATGASGSSSSKHFIEHFGDKFELSMWSYRDAEDFAMSIRPNNGECESLSVEQDHEFGLRIRTWSNGQLMSFWQHPDGSIQAAWSSDEKDAFRVGSYSEFLSHESAFAEKFWAQLENIGIRKPITKDDPRILPAIESILQLMNPDPLKDADAAISQLAAAEYKARLEAKRKIENNYFAWQTKIEETLKQANLDAETKAQLNKIVLTAGAKASLPKNEIDQFIEDNSLLTNRDYLSSIVESAPAELRKLLQNRIAELAK